VQDYINNLSVGRDLIINDIADKILNADSNILDIGNPNQPLDDIYIWRSRDGPALRGSPCGKPGIGHQPRLPVRDRI
jgi:hypothetical protein